MDLTDKIYKYILDLPDKMLEKSTIMHNIKVLYEDLVRKKFQPFSSNIPKSKILGNDKKWEDSAEIFFYFSNIFLFQWFCYFFKWLFLNIVTGLIIVRKLDRNKSDYLL